MTIQIVEILGRATQGVTKPFRCRGEDGAIYYVKGLGATRHSLIAEYVCGCLAKDFGLPVPDFEVVEVPEALITWSTIEGIADLGAGSAFGSRALPHVQELSVSHLPKVETTLCGDVLVFDWWMRNADRTLSEHGGNPNLLWDQEHSRLAVIDHNQAFDSAFDVQAFTESHVFHAHLSDIFDDWVEQERYRARLARVFDGFDQACDNLPPEWWWMADGVAANFDRDAARRTLARFEDNDFWRIA
jgi:hypothetical protein